jgi:hypothetical protein
MKRGDLVRIEYIRPGKEVTYYEEDFFAQNGTFHGGNLHQRRRGSKPPGRVVCLPPLGK